MASLTEISRRINASIPKLSVIAANGELLAANESLGAITYRIFNEGLKADGSPIGQYKNKYYQKRRSSKGRQTKYVDLQFTGDLFNSINVGELNGKPAVGITTKYGKDVAGYNEERYGEIFQASDSERDNALRIAQDFAIKELRNLIKGWS